MPSGKAAAAAGFGTGAVGGFIAGPLFRSIGLADVLKDHSHAPGFILGVAALFCVLALALSTLLTPPAETNRAPIRVMQIGLGICGVIALLCAATVLTDDMYHPTVDVAARFQPDLSGFKDPDAKDAVQLSLTYTDASSGQATQIPIDPRSGMRQKLRANETIYLNYNGLDHLANKYLALTEKYGERGAQLEVACQHATKDVCALLHPKMEDSASGNPENL